MKDITDFYNRLCMASNWEERKSILAKMNDKELMSLLNKVINGISLTNYRIRTELLTFVIEKYGTEITIQPDSPVDLKKLHNDGVKLRMLSQTSDMQIRKEIIDSLDNDIYKLKLLYTVDNTFEILEGLKKDPKTDLTKIAFCKSRKDYFEKVQIIKSISDDTIKLELAEELGLQDWKEHIIASFASKPQNDKIKIAYIDNEENEHKKWRVIASLSSDEIKEEYLSTIQDETHIASIVASMDSDSSKTRILMSGKIGDAKAQKTIIKSIKDLDQRALLKLQILDKKGISRPDIRDWLIDFSSTALENCESFTKVFGKGYASKKMKDLQHVLKSDNEFAYVGNYYLGSKIISFGTDKDEIEPRLALHESVHFILRNSYWNGIATGTGIHTRSRTNNTEIGRGLNEGLTDWICEKAGCENSEASIHYATERKFIKQLELAIGEEKTMKLGKGGIDDNIPQCLGMTEEETIALLKQTDTLYNLGTRYMCYRTIIKALNSKDANIEELKTLEEFKEGKTKEEYEEDERKCLIDLTRVRYEVDSTIFEKYFKKEFEDFLKTDELNYDDVKKFLALSKLMESYTNNPEFQDMPSNRFQKQFSDLLKEKIRTQDFLAWETLYLIDQENNSFVEAEQQETIKTILPEKSRQHSKDNRKDVDREI